ncbi:MAG TPA: ATP-binding protein, partial [Azospirillaceae bacterium]|nr:ATP-binding protein [Azospirillaceae bacterium]
SNHPAAAGLNLGPAAGMLATAARGPDGRTLTLLAFRGELVREVFWGGDPNKPVSVDGERLEPRASFSLWRETVTGRCREWDDDGVLGWRGLKQLLESRNRGGELISRIAADIDRLALGVDSQDSLVRSCVNAMAQPSIVARHDAEYPHGRTLAANRAFRAAFQMMADELEGATLPDLTRALGFDPDSVTSLPPGAGLDAVVRAAGVGERWFTINHRPLLCVGVGMSQSALSLWSLEDITGFRRVEDALRSAERKAVATDRAKSAFIAGVSHELRTPLNAIIGFSEMMLGRVFGELGDERYVKYAEHIHSSGQHLLGVISDVLDATRIERGAYALDEEDFDLVQTVEECCAMVEQLAVKRGVTLTHACAPSSIILRGDPRAVRQILLNLMSNAVKFTPAGGRVRCRAQGYPGEPAVIEVVDNGVGIAQENQHHVFDPFYQENQRPDLASGGLGLGLSLVKVLTDLHGGRVRLESRKGVGTSIQVQFPLWRTANPCQSVAALYGSSANI